MRLAIIMELASPWARDIASSLVQHGHEVHLIDFAKARPATGYMRVQDEFQSHEVAELCQRVAGCHLLQTRLVSNLRYVLPAAQVRRIVKTCRVDLLLALYGGGFAALAYTSGIRPYAVYVVGSDVLFASGLSKKLSRLALTRAARVFCNGEYLSHRTRELAPGAALYPLYIGVDTSRFSPGIRKSEPIRIICTRGFMPVYNNELLVRALTYLPESVPEFRVTFVSRGPQLEAVQRLADQILSPGIRQRVEFLGGISNSELVTLLRMAHIYVSVSLSDGTSISLLEALASGVFPVLSDIPQNREWVTPDRDNGILVPPDKPEKLARALTLALCDEQRRLRVMDYNRSLVSRRANRDQNMEYLNAELEHLVAPPETAFVPKYQPVI